MRHASHSSDVDRLGRETCIVGVVLVLVLLCLLPTACDKGGATAAAPADSTSVSFNTADGVTLRGHLFGSGESGVILCHMYPADQASWYAAAAGR